MPLFVYYKQPCLAHDQLACIKCLLPSCPKYHNDHYKSLHMYHTGSIPTLKKNISSGLDKAGGSPCTRDIILFKNSECTKCTHCVWACKTKCQTLMCAFTTSICFQPKIMWQRSSYKMEHLTSKSGIVIKEIAHINIEHNLQASKCTCTHINLYFCSIPTLPTVKIKPIVTNKQCLNQSKTKICTLSYALKHDAFIPCDAVLGIQHTDQTPVSPLHLHHQTPSKIFKTSREQPQACTALLAASRCAWATASLIIPAYTLHWHATYGSHHF